MTFARTLIRELVDKRLWPVAVLLVLALVAVPLMLGGGGSASSVEPLSDVAAPDAGSTPVTAVELAPPPAGGTRSGKVRDPFRRGAKKEPGLGAGTTTTATFESSGGGTPTSLEGGGTTAGGGGTTAGGGTTPEDATSSPGESKTASPNRARSVYRTTVRWGAGDSAKAQQILRLTPLGGLNSQALRLAPLGGLNSPALLYLGVDEDGKHALFLLGPQTTSIGDAECPDAGCRVISLARGDSQTVAVQPAGAQPAQFELKVVSVERDELSTAARASRSRAKEHPDGRDYLRSLIQDAATAHVIGAFAFDRGKGVMVEAPTSPKLAAP